MGGRRYSLPVSRQFVEDVIDGQEFVGDLLKWIMRIGGCCTGLEMQAWMNGRQLNGAGEDILTGLQEQEILVFAMRVHEGLDCRGNSLDTWHTWNGPLGEKQGETNRLLVASARLDASWCHWAVTEYAYGRLKRWYDDVTRKYKCREFLVESERRKELRQMEAA